MSSKTIASFGSLLIWLCPLKLYIYIPVPGHSKCNHCSLWQLYSCEAIFRLGFSHRSWEAKTCCVRLFPCKCSTAYLHADCHGTVLFMWKRILGITTYFSHRIYFHSTALIPANVPFDRFKHFYDLLLILFFCSCVMRTMYLCPLLSVAVISVWRFDIWITEARFNAIWSESIAYAPAVFLYHLSPIAAEMQLIQASSP